MHLLLPTLLLLSLAISSSGMPQDRAATRPPEPVPTTVTLAFAWPAGMSVVTTSTRKRSRIPASQREMSLVSRYTLAVETLDDKLRIRSLDPSFEIDGQSGPLAPADAQGITQLAGLTADYLVTKNGDYVGLHDLPGFRSVVQQFVKQVTPSNADEKARTVIQEMLTSEAFLNAQASQQWHAMIGAWNGAAMRLGEPITTSSRETIPLFGGHEALMNTTYLASHWVDCRRGSVLRRCVQLDATTTVDANDMKRLIETMMVRLGQKGGMPPVETLDVENRVRLVAEPDSLIPHVCTLTKKVRIVVLDNGQRHAMEQLDTTDLAFSYGR